MAEYEMMKNIGGVTIQQYKTDVGFRTLVESVNENLYVIPKYQRKYRWSKEQVIALVESLICGFFYVVYEKMGVRKTITN